jgi:hypothetical protein
MVTFGAEDQIIIRSDQVLSFYQNLIFALEAVVIFAERPYGFEV